MSCLFCKIANHTIPGDIVTETDTIISFNDINPKAPHHVLIIPKNHIATINDLTDENTLLVGEMVQTAKKIAEERGIAEDGYRLIFNCNAHGGQEVYHIHLHLLGGRKLTWPPG